MGGRGPAASDDTHFAATARAPIRHPPPVALTTQPPPQVFLSDVAELFGVLHANGVRILAVEKAKGLQVTIEKVGGGSSAGASQLIPRSPIRVGIQMHGVSFLRDALREVGFPCDAFV